MTEIPTCHRTLLPEDRLVEKELVDSQKRQQIGQFAEKVRSALRLSSPVTTASLEEAIRELNGHVVPGDPLDVEASIEKVGANSFKITLDRSMPPNRQVFSLAHELGHLFLHMGFGNRDRWERVPNYSESYARRRYNEEEFEANEFAAALLMPEREFKEAYERKLKIPDLARTFGVSPDAALIRSRWLRLTSWP